MVRLRTFTLIVACAIFYARPDSIAKWVVGEAVQRAGAKAPRLPSDDAGSRAAAWQRLEVALLAGRGENALDPKVFRSVCPPIPGHE